MKTFEEFNWNPFKKKIDNHRDVDPFGEEDWDDKKYFNIFIEFLKKEKIYDNFIEYISDPDISIYASCIEDLNGMKPESFLLHSFTWRKTDEKDDFWSKKNIKWMNKLRKIR